MPSSPAVYIFEDAHQTPLYIGKTIHLRTRIRQHLKVALTEEAKQSVFMKMAKTLSFYLVDTDLEAILLEARLIRLYQPHYNAISKDDKTRLYIVITNDEFPRIRIDHKTGIQPSESFYGPFTNSHRTQYILKLARRIFKFCSNPPKDGEIGRPCFYYHLNLCTGACVGKVTGREYRQQIGLLKRFLNGQTRSLARKLRHQIREESKHEHFEEAAMYKRQLENLLAVAVSSTRSGAFLEGIPQTDKQLRRLVQILGSVGLKVNPERIEGYDMATLSQTNTVGSMVVFQLGGEAKDQYRKFRIQTSQMGDPYAMAEVLERRFRHHEWPMPGLVMLDGGKPQLSIAGPKIPEGIPYISLAKREETIIVPKDGEYVEIQLSADDPALQLLQKVRDEAHRFANKYQRTLRERVAIR